MHRIGVIEGRRSHLRVDEARQRHLRHLPRALPRRGLAPRGQRSVAGEGELAPRAARRSFVYGAAHAVGKGRVADAVEHHLRHRLLALDRRSEEHTSELQSLMRISYAVSCLKTTSTNLDERIHT